MIKNVKGEKEDEGDNTFANITEYRLKTSKKTRTRTPSPRYLGIRIQMLRERRKTRKTTLLQE